MSGWEYCAIFRVGKKKGAPKSVSLTLTHFTGDGAKITRLADDYEESPDPLARAISDLGSEGWEMVGCGNTAENSHSIYFKRAES